MASSVSVLFEPTAERELDDAIEWYQHRAGLGDDLAAEVGRFIERIRERPEMYARVKKDYRRAMVDRFPYAIYYEFIANTVIIYSVFHCSRDPAKLDKLLP